MFVAGLSPTRGRQEGERSHAREGTEKPGYRNRSRLFSLLNRTQASVVYRCFVGLRLLSYEDLCRQAIGKSDPEWPPPPQSRHRRAKRSGQRREGPTLPSRSPARPRHYAFRKVSRSALMVSASVVGMPCGKPLVGFQCAILQQFLPTAVPNRHTARSGRHRHASPGPAR